MKIKNIVNISLILLALSVGYFLSKESRSKSVVINCRNTTEKYNCWKGFLIENLKQEGLISTFDSIGTLYAKESDFIPLCHTITHDIGKEAYFMFASNKKLDINSSISSCGYGFYHGFMTTLLHEGGTIKQAKKFCLDVDTQLSAYGDKTNLACYHGIGHGAVEDGKNLGSFGSVKEFIKPGLDICRNISASQIEIHQCGTGVFNALAIGLIAQAKLVKSYENPYTVCKDIDLDFRKSCFEQMNTRALFTAGDNFDKAAKFVYEIEDQGYAQSAIIQLASDTVAQRVGQNYSYAKEVKTCRSILPNLRIPCINGLVGGISEFGKPGEEYIEAINFCKSLSPVEDEMRNCYASLISGAKSLYNKETINKICSLVERKYSEMCGRL